MRKYELTAIDMEAIESLRSRATRRLQTDMNAAITRGECKSPESMPQCIANNRELQSILEHVRGIVPDAEGWDNMTVRLAIARHGQPRWKGKEDQQPSFDELPTT